MNALASYHSYFAGIYPIPKPPRGEIYIGVSVILLSIILFHNKSCLVSTSLEEFPQDNCGDINQYYCYAILICFGIFIIAFRFNCFAFQYVK